MKLKWWEWLIVLGIVAVLFKSGIGFMVADTITDPGSKLPDIDIK